jgi:membrane-bound lytic murein transglycosylase A
MMRRGRVACGTIGLLIAWLVSPEAAEPLRIPESELEPVAFESLDGWAAEDHRAAFAAFRESCIAVSRAVEPRAAKRAGRPVRPIHHALDKACVVARELRGPIGALSARRFFESEFRAVRISRLGERDGFITGYYEPEVEGRRTPDHEFRYPMYRKPPELVARRQAGVVGFPNRGKVGRREGKKLVEYHDRAAIEDGALKGRGLEICWLRDPIDAFFIHIQGSARIRLEDGKLLRLNYEAHNGHTYFAVGRALADRGIVPRAEMTMDKIRTYFAEMPEEGREMMRMNRSFIFFREVELAPEAEAIGAQGVPLVRERSIAVDRALHAYGTPFWIEAELPLTIESEHTLVPFRRMMLAQDTGSAIVGPARADIYFGAGIDAGTVAGRLRHPGRFYMLVPRALDPGLHGREIPLPPSRPKT